MCQSGPNHHRRSTVCGPWIDRLHRVAPIRGGEEPGRLASCGRSVRGVKLGAARADLAPRPMNQSRPNWCHRSTAVGPRMDCLRYPGRGYTVGASIRPSSLSSFVRGGAAQTVTPRLADDRVESGTRNRTICEPKVEGHLWPVSVDWFGRGSRSRVWLPLLPKARNWPLRGKILPLSGLAQLPRLS